MGSCITDPAIVSCTDQSGQTESLGQHPGLDWEEDQWRDGKRLDKLEKHTREMWINNHRQTILTFARECRADIEHSSDEWTNVLNVAEEYEKYVTENKVTNGIITQDTEYIRNLYQEMSREHRI